MTTTKSGKRPTRFKGTRLVMVSAGVAAFGVFFGVVARQASQADQAPPAVTSSVAATSAASQPVPVTTTGAAARVAPQPAPPVAKAAPRARTSRAS